ncbi:MAG: dTMP kinase [Candidatus Bipolaricaulota bacterium]|nr:dTMP kinase [Candidatus Bipolaricaulota bacterium]
MRKIELRKKLIVFEGLDFTGKSTQVEILGRHLQKMDLPVTTTREPGGTVLGEVVRSVILSNEHTELLPLSELSLFITCRAQLSAEVIEPALDAGHVVVSSRYRLSSLGYQGYGRGLDLTLIERMNEIATSGRQPDLTFLLDLPAEKALERRGKVRDRIEQEDLAFYRRVRTGYLDLTRGDPRVHLLDATISIDEIARKVLEYLSL